MKVLQNIKSELIVSIDIETVRVAENFEDLSEDYQSAWEYKNKFEGKVPDNDVLADVWKRSASLYAEFSKVCAVSLSYLNPQGKLFCKEFYGKNEKGLLQSLSITLNNMQASNSEYRLVGHASKYFDYPFLAKRYIINGLDIPSSCDASDTKPWLDKNLCTNELWKCGGTGPGSSLQALCNVLNIPISKVDLVGDEVGRAYYEGDLERIGHYCSYDTVATFNIFRRFKQESIFQFDEVTYVTAYSENKEVENEELQKIPLLKRLYLNNQITLDIKNEVEELLKNNPPTEKEKQHLYTILRGAYIRTNFESNDQDSKKTIELKEKEIKKLLCIT